MVIFKKTVKLVIDIENAIDVDDCEYIEYSNIDDIFMPDEMYVLQPEYLNVNCLIIEINDVEHFLTKNDIIRQIVSSDYDKYYNFNIIIISENISRKYI